MENKVFLPKLGRAKDEIIILAWHVEDNQDCEKDQLICEVESDKTAVEIHSKWCGKIKILEEVGAKLKSEQCIAIIKS